MKKMMQCDQFQSREELYRDIFSVVKTEDCYSVADWMFKHYMNLTEDDMIRLGLTDKDEELFLLLLSMGEGDEFMYSKEELFPIIEYYHNLD